MVARYRGAEIKTEGDGFFVVFPAVSAAVQCGLAITEGAREAVEPGTHGINVGATVKIFETFHGGSRETIGANRANPLPLLLPAIDLLHALGQQLAAGRILRAVETVLSEGRVRSRDLGGLASTSEIAEAICAAL